MNGEWYHFDGSATEVATSIGKAMGDQVLMPISGNRGCVVFGTHYSVVILDTST